MAGGRPTNYKQSVARAICMRLMDGESLRSICKLENYPARRTVLYWLISNQEFMRQYTQAREIQQELHYDELFELSEAPLTAEDSNIFVQRDRLRIDTRKWTMERMSAKKYGSKQAVDHTSSDGSMTPAKNLSDEDLLRIASE